MVAYILYGYGSGGSRIFVSGGASMGMGAIESKNALWAHFWTFSAAEKRKFFFGMGAIAPSAPPPKSATGPAQPHLTLDLASHENTYFQASCALVQGCPDKPMTTTVIGNCRILLAGRYEFSFSSL
jgi:hypothetical protein